MKTVMGMDGSDGCTIMWMCLMPLNLNIVKMVQFLCLLPKFFFNVFTITSFWQKQRTEQKTKTKNCHKDAEKQSWQLQVGRPSLTWKRSRAGWSGADRSPAEPGRGATAHTQPAEATSKMKETGYTHWKRREKCQDLPAMYLSTYKVRRNVWKTLKPTGIEVGGR